MIIPNPTENVAKENKNKKDERLYVRLTENEKKKIEYMKKYHSKTSMSDYILWLVNQDVKRSRKVKEVKDLGKL